MKRFLLAVSIIQLSLLVGCGEPPPPSAENNGVKIDRWMIIADKMYPVVTIYYGKDEFVLLEDQGGLLHLQDLRRDIPKDWVECQDGSVLVRNGENGLKKIIPRRIPGIFTLTYLKREAAVVLHQPDEYYSLVRVSGNKKETYQLRVYYHYNPCGDWEPDLKLLSTETTDEPPK